MNNNEAIEDYNYILNNQVISLKAKQTISLVTQKTKFNPIKLLKYNNLTLEQAKSLLVGEKTIINFDEDSSNPDKIIYVEISKYSNGSYYKVKELNNRFYEREEVV